MFAAITSAETELFNRHDGTISVRLFHPSWIISFSSCCDKAKTASDLCIILR